MGLRVVNFGTSKKKEEEQDKIDDKPDARYNQIE